MARSGDVPLRAVTFDLWNTLLREQHRVNRDRRIDNWLGLLEGEATALERDRLGAALDVSWRRFDDAWRANLSYGAADAVRDALEHLGLQPPADVVEALVSAITDPAPELVPAAADNIEAALATLKDHGVAIGIICDVGLTPSRTLRRYLDQHGLLGYFDHWSFSDEVGTFKPDPVIFHHALAGLGGVEPAAAAHVGDLRRTDIGGAQDLGIFAVRYTGVNDDPPGLDTGSGSLAEGDAVIADHADLLGALGLSA